MRIAWFRATDADASDLLDRTAVLIDELRATHDIAVIVERSAHDFVWRQLQRPWDLCVFELDNTREHQFVWGYVSNYPGVALLHSIDLAHFRVAVLASRVAVVSDRGLAQRLDARFPTANIRYAPAFAGTAHDSGAAEVALPSTDRGAAAAFAPIRLAVYDDRDRGHLIDRAIERARNAGAMVEVLERGTIRGALAGADVVIAPGWPPFHSSSTPLLAAMAAGKAVITTETETTAEWPALDPQTWRPRGLSVSDSPVAVTVDPRDEEHSLMLAIRKLAADATLRDQLGRAARVWWETNATPVRAASAWQAILAEAMELSPPPRPNDWPRQFAGNGTELAREILGEFGITGSE
jgi:hypothetical protein